MDASRFPAAPAARRFHCPETHPRHDPALAQRVHSPGVPSLVRPANYFHVACDIGYPSSPTALRASSRVMNSAAATLPSSTVQRPDPNSLTSELEPAERP